jgi:hypothetical protein
MRDAPSSFPDDATMVLELEANVLLVDLELVGDGPAHLLFRIEQALASRPEIQIRDPKIPLSVGVQSDLCSMGLQYHASILSVGCGRRKRTHRICP